MVIMERAEMTGSAWTSLEMPKKLLTICLSIPDQQVAARIRAYRVNPEDSAKGLADYEPGSSYSY